MNNLLQKLSYKNTDRCLVLNSSEDFKGHITSLRNEGVTIDDERMPSTIYDFALVFVTSIDEIGVTASMTIKSLIRNSPTFWIAYPKSTSVKYKTDISNPSDWDVMSTMGFQKGLHVDIDDNWSAYNFIRAN